MIAQTKRSKSMEQAWTKFCEDIENGKYHTATILKNEKAIQAFYSETNKHEQKIRDAYRRARNYVVV